MRWLYKLERRHPRFGVPNLMIYVVVAMAFVFVVDRVMPDRPLSALLYFDRDLILAGEIWRLLTFIFLPPQSSLFFILFALYFYYMIGGSLEGEWGTVTFTVYYVIGILGTIAAGFIAGAATNAFLNLSLFFAFAILHPDHQLLILFILPVKIKYIAFLNMLVYLYSFVMGSWGNRASIIASLINVFLFFGGTFLKNIKRESQYRRTRQQFRRQNQQSKRDSFRFR